MEWPRLPCKSSTKGLWREKHANLVMWCIMVITELCGYRCPLELIQGLLTVRAWLNLASLPHCLMVSSSAPRRWNLRPTQVFLVHYKTLKRTKPSQWETSMSTSRTKGSWKSTNSPLDGKRTRWRETSPVSISDFITFSVSVCLIYQLMGGYQTSLHPHSYLTRGQVLFG